MAMSRCESRLTEPCSGTVPQHEQTTTVMTEPPRSGSPWPADFASGPQASRSFFGAPPGLVNLVYRGRPAAPGVLCGAFTGGAPVAITRPLARSRVAADRRRAVAEGEEVARVAH